MYLINHLAVSRVFQIPPYTKKRVYTKQRLTKQRLLQNSDYYKTETVTKRRILQNDDCYKKNIFIYSTKTLCCYSFNLVIHTKIKKINVYIFYVGNGSIFLMQACIMMTIPLGSQHILWEIFKIWPMDKVIDEIKFEIINSCVLSRYWIYYLVFI